ncbi:Hypothetical predicted protein [Xyrichtys novacula]|uniref:Uncharacterized protein n=1 Tax=Xyrichtys novacula TaxID=13765 RepID=A0AAV1G0H4_XYRNO|nr:Hypothetical predicted protein [Xyrichtys novacula]
MNLIRMQEKKCFLGRPPDPLDGANQKQLFFKAGSGLLGGSCVFSSWNIRNVKVQSQRYNPSPKSNNLSFSSGMFTSTLDRTIICSLTVSQTEGVCFWSQCFSVPSYVFRVTYTHKHTHTCTYIHSVSVNWSIRNVMGGGRKS